MSSLIEEAIRSSQLEGVSTTRATAKEMIRSRKEPADRGERMILNNFHAMETVESLAEEPLSKEVIFELHSILTDGTIDDPSAAGTFRRRDDQIVVELINSVDTAHVPPPAAELPERLDALVRLRTGQARKTGFTPCSEPSSSISWSVMTIRSSAEMDGWPARWKPMRTRDA